MLLYSIVNLMILNVVTIVGGTHYRYLDMMSGTGTSGGVTFFVKKANQSLVVDVPACDMGSRSSQSE
jgi:hypothetical protein